MTGTPAALRAVEAAAPPLDAHQRVLVEQEAAVAAFGASAASAQDTVKIGFTGPLSGKTINRYAERLLVACLEVMRSERTSGRKREHSPAS